MTQTLNVEREELLARAVELEVPLPTPPSTDPHAPCALSFTVDAATQLELSADSMRLYLNACEREWRRLAQSLRNAAKAYEQVDEDSAEAMAGAMEGTSRGVDANASMMNCDPDEDYVPPPPPPPPPPFQYPYYEVRQAASDIEAPDQGVAFAVFANEWDTYQRTLQNTTYRFRPFTQWDGLSAAVVEGNFELHRQWVYQMAQLCSVLSSQAKTAATAHKWAITEHPSSYEVSDCDKWYKKYSQDPFYERYLYQIIEWYGKLQKKSEETLAEYVKRASLPLTPVNPKSPPVAHRIDPPPKPPPPDPDPGDTDGEVPDDGLPDDGLPGDDPSGTPTTPAMPSAGMPPPSGVPPVPDTAAFNDALKGLSDKPSGGDGMKPASVGGGGGGVPGMPGIPSMPMQPPVGAESVAPSGAAAGTPGAGRGLPGVGGGPGGGPMGPMAPMAPGGQGQGKNDKAERGPAGDEALYEEERPWTEGVIGNRRRQGAPDGKETK